MSLPVTLKDSEVSAPSPAVCNPRGAQPSGCDNNPFPEKQSFCLWRNNQEAEPCPWGGACGTGGQLLWVPICPCSPPVLCRSGHWIAGGAQLGHRAHACAMGTWGRPVASGGGAVRPARPTGDLAQLGRGFPLERISSFSFLNLAPLEQHSQHSAHLTWAVAGPGRPHGELHPTSSLAQTVMRFVPVSCEHRRPCGQSGLNVTQKVVKEL